MPHSSETTVVALYLTLLLRLPLNRFEQHVCRVTEMEMVRHLWDNGSGWVAGEGLFFSGPGHKDRLTSLGEEGPHLLPSVAKKPGGDRDRSTIWGWWPWNQNPHPKHTLQIQFSINEIFSGSVAPSALSAREGEGGSPLDHDYPSPNHPSVPGRVFCCPTSPHNVNSTLQVRNTTPILPARYPYPGAPALPA